MITCKFEEYGEALLRHAVVDAILVKDDKLLLVKRSKKLIEGGKWALPGGYIDRDESIREAIKREVLEETGYQVKNTILFTITDDIKGVKKDRQNISFVFICQIGELVSKPDWEVEEARWFELNSLPVKETIAFDHHHLIELYKQSLLGKKVEVLK